MSGLRSSSIAIVNAITQMLRDRYRFGYPILKELLQNADDARARRFRADFYDVLPGSEVATNPLLRVPGVLVLNDGRFSDQDREDILSFSESNKAGDSSQAGKFGIGQKAVFHLCDAFVVVSRGHGVRPRCTVVNPFFDLDHLRDNDAKSWDGIDDAVDGAILRDLFPDRVLWKRNRCLGIWIPFHRKLPHASKAVFANQYPTVGEVREEWSDRKARDKLCTALTLLKHLEEVEIRQNGIPPMILRVTNYPAQSHGDQQHGHDRAERLERIENLGSHPSLAGSAPTDQLKRLGGGIRTDADDTPPYRFVGRQIHDPAPDAKSELGRLVDKDEHWPTTFTRRSRDPIREKGKAHGAVTLWRNPSAYCAKPKLTISWAVFLPVSSDPPIDIDVSRLIGENDGIGDVHILLHGYFFLDSGRKSIEGVGAPADRADEAVRPDATQLARGEPPRNEAELRRDWNGALCKEVVLPLIPRVLHDALVREVVAVCHFPSLLRSLAGAKWFKDRRRAVCDRDALVCVLDLPESLGAASLTEPTWNIVSAGRAFRPFPNVDTPGEAVAELFPNVRSWARDRNVVLCIRPEASLTADVMEWPSADLTTLFRTLSRRAFQRRSQALTTFLAKFVAGISHKESDTKAQVRTDPDALDKVAPDVLRALRQAIVDDRDLASAGSIREVLDQLSPRLFCTVPEKLNRDLLRVLAHANTDILPVPEDWLRLESDSDGSARTAHPPTSATDATTLILALAPEIDGRHGPEARSAVLELIAGVGDIGELASRLEASGASICRVRNVRRDEHEYCSLKDLKERATKGWVFAGDGTRKHLPKVVQALLDVEPVVGGKVTVKLLNALGRDDSAPRKVEKQTLSDLVNVATEFARETNSRSRALKELRRMDGDNDRAAMRRLCAGSPVDDDTVLYRLQDGIGGLAGVIRDIMGTVEHEVLVDREIVVELGGDDVGMQTVGVSYFNRVVQDSALLTALESRGVSEPERCEFFERRDIDCKVLRQLPIFGRTLGRTDDVFVGNACKVFHVTDRWAVPPSLQGDVAVLVPCGGPEVRERQRKLVDEWAPKTQIETALAMEPHEHWKEILEAVDALEAHEWDGVRNRLRDVEWMPRNGGAPVSPGSVLHIEGEIADAWRALQEEASLSRLVTMDDLPSEVRNHSGYLRLAEIGALPSPDDSRGRLRELLRKASVVGRLGHARGYPTKAVARLAEARVDLGLPGWQLLASLLREDKNAGNRQAFVECFVSADESQVSLAAGYLTRLADSAAERGIDADHVLRAYRHSVKGVATWPMSSRQALFREAKVPTENGKWNHGTTVVGVVRQGHGLDPHYVLDRRCATILDVDGPDIDSSRKGSDTTRSYRAPPRILETEVKLTRMCEHHDETLADFLDLWQNKVPDTLVVAFFALLGDRPSLKEHAARWRVHADDLSAWWAEIHDELEMRVRSGLEIVLNVSLHTGETVSVTSLSGDKTEVPLADGTDSLLLGNDPRVDEHYEAKDGEQKRYYVCRLRIRDQPIGGMSRNAMADRFLDFIRDVINKNIVYLRKDRVAVREKLLEKAANVSDTILRKVKKRLRDELPSVLRTLAVSKHSDVHKAWTQFDKRSVEGNGMDSAKRDLWDAVDTSATHEELLEAVRAKVRQYGYSSARVLFELFQNADDAYRQIKSGTRQPCVFRLRLEPCSVETGGFRVIHWGRPINEPGDDADGGHRSDLWNMLVLGSSEKTGDEELAGQFGLGFKCVHLISDSVGIASGFLSLRIHGGLIPGEWSGGGEACDGEGPGATVIDVPWGATADGEEAVESFLSAIPWLLLFSKRVRRIEVHGEQMKVVEANGGVRVADGVRMVTVGKTRVLKFALSDDFSLVVRLDGNGPARLSGAEVPTLWNLAPLEEGMSSGCVLNGGFDLSPGRTRLSGSRDYQSQEMRDRGNAYGHRLCRLYDAASRDWNGFTEKLGLDADINQDMFWRGLFKVVEADLGDDSVVRHLHGRHRGYGKLAAKRPVVPTGLEYPFDKPVRASSVSYRTTEALKRADVQRVVLTKWPEVSALAKAGAVVSGPVAMMLGRLGFRIQSGETRRSFWELSVSAAVRRELGTDGRVEPELAKLLGEVINPAYVSRPPISWEKDSVCQALADAEFQCRDREWRAADAVWALRSDADEDLLSDFAPDNVVLHPDYEGPGLEFFEVAKAAWPAPQADDICQWALDATDDDARRAVLKYAVHGERGWEVAKALKKERPQWLPAYVDGCSEDDKEKLDWLLGRAVGSDSDRGYKEIERDQVLDPDKHELERVGKMGEKRAVEYLKEEFRESDIDWVSEFSGPGGDDSLGYDIQFDHRGKTWHVEVKSTADDPRVYVSPNQYNTARRIAATRCETGDEWCILHVRNALSEAPDFYWVPNPWGDTPIGMIREPTKG